MGFGVSHFRFLGSDFGLRFSGFRLLLPAVKFLVSDSGLRDSVVGVRVLHVEFAFCGDVTHYALQGRDQQRES